MSIPAGMNSNPARDTVAPNDSAVATATSCPASCIAVANGTNGEKCPKAGIVVNSARTSS
jgi:hypothetical protein